MKRTPKKKQAISSAGKSNNSNNNNVETDQSRIDFAEYIKSMEINEFNQLIAIIVDYYSYKQENDFHGNDNMNKESDDLYGSRQDNAKESEFIPVRVNQSIEAAFMKQLSKFQ